MASLKGVVLMAVVIMATLSCGFAQEGSGPSPAPAPSPISGDAVYSVPASAALLGSSLVLSLLALIKY